MAPEWNQPDNSANHPYLVQGMETILLEGKADTPLRFTIRHGGIYENMADGKYTISDKNGKVIAVGRVPYGTQTIEVKVPRTEFYYLKYEDNSAGWAFTPIEGVRSAFVLDRSNGGRLGAYRGNFSFYVPKGTKEIKLYASKPRPTNYFSVWTPDFKSVGNYPGPNPTPGRNYVKGNGRVISLPVPEGMDGKLWHTDMLGASYYFLNIPNILLTRTTGPILPREIAEKDGLKF